MKNVAIVSGTHGNEITGVKLLQKYKNNLIERKNLKIHLELANLEAIKNNVRYIDEDLNRAFHKNNLNSFNQDSYESKRAYELNELLGPKFNNPKMDFIIDLHTTTANMQNTLIVYNNPINLKLAKYVQDNCENVHIYVSDKNISDTIALQSIAPNSVLVELGPIPQGVLEHSMLDDMEKITNSILDFIEKFSNNKNFDVTGDIVAYERGEPVKYPTDNNGNISAIIHKDFQNKNFKLLKKGDPIFVTFQGKTIAYQGEEGYPIFINEASYYKSNMAFRLNKRLDITIPPRQY